MQKVTASLFAVPVRIVRNTNAGSKNDQWAKIINAKTGQTLHIGQLGYIRRTARERYNVNVLF